MRSTSTRTRCARSPSIRRRLQSTRPSARSWSSPAESRRSTSPESRPTLASRSSNLSFATPSRSAARSKRRRDPEDRAAEPRALDALRLPLRELLLRLASLLQRHLLLLQVLLEERNDVVLAHRLRRRDQAVVDGDLVRLGLDDAGEDDGVVQLLVDVLEHLLAFLLQ